ncbi:MAG: DNA polymerase III subunit delta [Planctomycetales bacterium]|nr:DNA polymerase III subunit delta [Planctomycetales bacterium]
MAAAEKPTSALKFLSKPIADPPSVCVVFGDEAFLKREILRELRRQVLGEDGEFSLTVTTGKEAEPRDVWDQLATVSMFGGGRRMVVIEEADDFVSRRRPVLEEYVQHPKPTGVLVLEVRTWASNTRLYKAVAASGLQIECKSPTPGELKKWLTSRTQKIHGAELEPAALETLMELIEPEIGLLDQELARLALLTGAERVITPQLVEANVGSWRTKSTWDLIDDAAAGKAAEALLQLDRLLAAGENPIALLGQIASTFRRFAQATRLVEQAERERRREPLRSMLQQAGFKPFVLGKAEQQLKQIGRDRGRQLYRWLLAADLAIKGASSTPARARLVLEELIVRLSRQADPRLTASKA